MSSISSLTETLGAMSASYETSDTAKHVLQQKELVPLIGPFAVGKTALMRAAENLDREFGRVRSFTTRPRRVGEEGDAYDFLPHSDATLRQIQAQATRRELVQFIVHPTTGNVYGSTVDSYRTTYSMLDTMPSSLPGLLSLPFREIKKVAIAVPPDVWEHRMAERLRSGDVSDIRKRLAEGVANITWSLDQGNDLAWVINGACDISTVARNLTRVVKDGYRPDKSARVTAAQLLTRLKALQAA